MWNPTVFIKWQRHVELENAFWKWLATGDPVVEWHNYAVIYSPNTHTIRWALRPITRLFRYIKSY